MVLKCLARDDAPYHVAIDKSLKRNPSAGVYMLHSHQRLGMHEVAGFTLDKVDYAVLSDRAT